MKTLTVLILTALLAIIFLPSLSTPVVAQDRAPAGITDTPTPTPAFTPTPTVEPTEPPVPPVVPEASTLLMLGSAASGLAGYVGLQIRARRGRA